MRKAIAALGCLTLLAAGLAESAGAQDASRQSAIFKFTKERPGVSTGLVLRVDYINPNDPAAKPPAVSTVTETLAPGAAFDTSAPELCTAPDPVLILLGSSACPAGSAVGKGHLTLDTGLPAPARQLDVEVDFFNNQGELIFLSQATALDIPRVVTRATVDERTSVSQAPPFLPGTPPDGAAIDTVRVRLPALSREVDGDLRAYVRTPPTCPRRGYWVNKVNFEYFDGVSQTVRSRSHCER